ncbi:transporter, major facilitator family protein [Ancylostoma ceylanicum]|uniref:Transporter, major facilitator family protein n=1 Tax=Ancylostoma ceylanicum TaxID=53326 RepID=A0A0D6L823_9BILA|nr:transporter, major facilitator family protein [Ancylostoma ceylanicum]
MFTARYYITVITVVLGGSAQFYSYGIVNPAQRLLTSWINETYIDRYGGPLTLTQSNLLWSFVVSSLAIGAIIGAALTGLVWLMLWSKCGDPIPPSKHHLPESYSITAEKFGRRDGLILNGVLNVFGAICELTSKSLRTPELLIVGRFIFGANMGLTSGLVPMYLMEITPVKRRGQAGTLHQVAVAFSDWFSLLIGLPEVLGNEKMWPLAFALPGLPALALCVILPFCPESPKYTLITLGEREKALSDISRLVDSNEAKPMFDMLVKESALDRSSKGTLRELFTSPELRVPLVVSVLVMIAQQFTGCTAVFAYSTEMFLNAKLSPEVARLSTLAIGIVYFLFACSAPFLIEKITWASYGTIFALVLYMCVYGVGSPIPWMITGELFSQQMKQRIKEMYNTDVMEQSIEITCFDFMPFRSTAVTVSVFVAWTFAFIISTAYLPFQQLVGVSLSYMPFIVVISISVVMMYYLLPETRGHSIDDIVLEVRHRTRSLSTGRLWEANRSSSRLELQRLLDTIEQRIYDSNDDLFE